MDLYKGTCEKNCRHDSLPRRNSASIISMRTGHALNVRVGWVYYCIAAVGQGIVSCFRIVTNLFSFVVRETYVVNPEFEGVNPRELMDTSVNGWVHHCMHILPQVKQQN